MPNPLELLTKPLQIGAQLAFGAIQKIQSLVGGGGDAQPEHAEPAEQPKPQQARPARASRPKQLDDATITDKVETILFRDKTVAKGKIDVNTANGKVWLRGEARTPEQIKELEAKARQVPEVKDVENLLHLPKTPANKREKRHSPPRKRTTPKRTTAERKTSAAPNAEPTPRELAAKGEGRQPAPLGSSGPASGNGNGSSGE